MHKFGKFAAVAALAALPIAATAGGIGNSVDLYYVSSGIEIDVPGLGSGDDDGDGFGAKGNFAFADNLFFSGEYQTVTYDDSDADFDQLRAGIGFNSDTSQPSVFYGLVEFIDVDLDGESDNGFGIHGGGHFKLSDVFGLNARIGYVDIGDGDGLEYLVGASFKLNDRFGLFADYRVTALEDGDTDLDIDDLRVGGRFNF